MDYTDIEGYLPADEDEVYNTKFFDLCSFIGAKLRKNGATDEELAFLGEMSCDPRFDLLIAAALIIVHESVEAKVGQDSEVLELTGILTFSMGRCTIPDDERTAEASHRQGLY